MKRIMILLMVLTLLSTAGWGADHEFWMMPTGTGNGTTSGTGAGGVNKAGEFDAILSYIGELSGGAIYPDGDTVTVHMATGNYNNMDNQDVFGWKEENCGLTYTFNPVSDNITGITITLAAGKAIYFRPFDDHTATSFTFNDIAFVGNSPSASCLFGIAYNTTGGTTNNAKIFNRCTFTNKTTVGDSGFKCINSAAGTVTFNTCTFDTSGYWGWFNNACTVSATNCTGSLSGSYHGFYLQGSGSLTMSSCTFERKDESSAIYQTGGTNLLAVVHAADTTKINISDTTLKSASLGYSCGIITTGACPFFHVKNANITVPLATIQLSTTTTDVLIDGLNETTGQNASLTGNAPTRLCFNKTGNWTAGDTIKCWVQKENQYSSHIFTVVAGHVTNAEVSADFIADWNANADAFCKTIVASADTASSTAFSKTIILMSCPTGPWSMSQPVSSIDTAGTYNCYNLMWNSTVADISCPRCPDNVVTLNAAYTYFRNYRVRNTDGMPYEGVSITGPHTAAGGSCGLFENLVITDSWFPLIDRGDGDTIRNCYTKSQWPFLNEHNAKYNKILNNTFYVLKSPEMNTGVYIGTGGGDYANHNTYFNNIIIADGQLTNTGIGDDTTSKVSCVLYVDPVDPANNVYDNVFDYNIYWVNGSGYLWRNNGADEITTLTALRTKWQLSLSTVAYYNDLHSININPGIDSNGYARNSSCVNYGRQNPNRTSGKTTIFGGGSSIFGN